MSGILDEVVTEPVHFKQMCSHLYYDSTACGHKFTQYSFMQIALFPSKNLQVSHFITATDSELRWIKELGKELRDLGALKAEEGSGFKKRVVKDHVTQRLKRRGLWVRPTDGLGIILFLLHCRW